MQAVHRPDFNATKDIWVNSEFGERAEGTSSFQGCDHPPSDAFKSGEQAGCLSGLGSPPPPTLRAKQDTQSFSYLLFGCRSGTASSLRLTEGGMGAGFAPSPSAHSSAPLQLGRWFHLLKQSSGFSYQGYNIWRSCLGPKHPLCGVKLKCP